MAAQWNQLLKLIAEIAPESVAYWRMKNGAEFYLAIPNRDFIGERTFLPHIEFPFLFDDIISISFNSTAGQARLGVSNNLRAVRRAISLTVGFTCEEHAAELVVYPSVANGGDVNFDYMNKHKL